ncbi:MAG TPA: hypothetical protein VIY49_17195 [Bryobacteraceae bacterium]
MGKRKNPAAVALGRKGGAVTGVKKGFAGISAKRLAEIQARALDTRRENAAKRAARAAK